MGTNTDPYQRCEGKYRLTRGIVETLVEFDNPFSILTKSTLVLRDKALLREAAERDLVRVNLSIGTLDDDVWKATEPGTPHPRQRVKAVEQLNAAGIPCGVLIAPILPGLSDAPEQVEAVTRACRDAGAVSITRGGLRLMPGVKEVYYRAPREDASASRRLLRASLRHPRLASFLVSALVSTHTEGATPERQDDAAGSAEAVVERR